MGANDLKTSYPFSLVQYGSYHAALVFLGRRVKLIDGLHLSWKNLSMTAAVVFAMKWISSAVALNAGARMI